MPSERVILKISGELFAKNEKHLSFDQYDTVAKQLIDINNQSKIQLAIIVGGGNIFRGREANNNVDPSEADSMGMLATIINGIGLREALVRNGATDTRLMTSVEIHKIAEPYIRLKAIHHLENNRNIIIAGGLGIPHFSTDSAVAHFAEELNCSKIYKASTVNGVYDSDPKQNPNAIKFDHITFQDTLDKKLNVMDRTAFAMCEKSKIPIFVFNIDNLNLLPRAIKGDYSFGTIISDN
jgi:uridylate kinase